MLFVYKALKEGKIVTGKIESQDAADGVLFLKNSGLFTIDIKPAHSSSSFFSSIFDRVSQNDIVDFTRQIAIMLNAGLTLVDSFDILKRQISKQSLLKITYELEKQVKGGNTLSSALRRYPHLFSNLYIALVKSGEASGKLNDILLKLSENLEKQREFKSKIKGALIYPVIVVVGMIVVVFIMMTFVIPKLLGLYKDFNVELPATTQLLITISNIFSNYWMFIIGGAIGSFILFKRYVHTKTGKLKFDSLLLKIPIFSNIMKMSVLVDLTRTLSILIGAGVSILEGLNIVIETTDNAVYQEAFKSIYRQVEKGTSVGQAMANENIFPPILIQMTTVGEQTGHLDETLMRISNYFELESELAVKTMTTLIEPTILVVLGLGVGFLVLAVITPIYNLTSSFK